MEVSSRFNPGFFYFLLFSVFFTLPYFLRHLLPTGVQVFRDDRVKFGWKVDFCFFSFSFRGSLMIPN